MTVELQAIPTDYISHHGILRGKMTSDEAVLTVFTADFAIPSTHITFQSPDITPIWCDISARREELSAAEILSRRLQGANPQ